ncbi:hypothetical protein [Bradyrhizobium sp. RP6]|uniref:hypothetical protein n=1 Tax=Bradyrhizobium sp. RP6 TaxID=2489596 RepID=UPI000F51F986|nr:hypothetical protein [Bradyrhizobium sp. RP6]RQH15709.1 hypothetical protein EHH60_00480 [Bradyrhizobium sp. RP6]
MVGSDHPAAVALRAVLDTEKKLVDTAPTTQAGLGALEAHLREDRHSQARGYIPQPLGRGIRHNDSLEGVDWLIAKRRAEIDSAS